MHKCYSYSCTLIDLDFTTELDEFMAVLDRRVLKSQPSQPIGLVAKKVRRAGEPSTQPPPPGAPSWAVKQGELMYDCAIAQYFTSYLYHNNFILISKFILYYLSIAQYC